MSTHQDTKTANANKSAISAEYVVVGGGMVGSAMALGLAKQGKQIVLIEAFPAREFAIEQGPDLRMSALALASVQLLDNLGAWEHIAALRVQSYNALSVWDKPWAKTAFHAHEVKQTRLGYFVENRITQLGLTHALLAYANVTILHTKVDTADTQGGIVRCEDGRIVHADWIIAADGVHSGIRKQAGIGTVAWDYEQQALGISIQSTYADEATADIAQGLTWQAFTPDGPQAFLPMHDNHASLVWYHHPQRIAELKALTPAALKDEICASFSPYLQEQVTDFTVLDKASFGLLRMHAKRYLQDKVILIGDAAHSINPLAGQGVNLGFADVACLLETIEHKRSLARSYELPRKHANLQMMTAMDALYHLFSNRNPLLNTLRNTGLFLADKGGFAKQAVIKKAMGL